MKFSDEQKAIIKNEICRGFSEAEKNRFLHISEQRNLDPMQNDIYPLRIAGKMTIHAGIDGLRKIASRNKDYCPGDISFEYEEKNGKLISATATAKKVFDNGAVVEFSHFLKFKEYDTGRSLWKSKPSVMLGKCAEAAVLRKGWPESLSGLYIREEFDLEKHKDSQKSSFDDEQPEIAPKKECERLEELLFDKQELRSKMLDFLNKKYKVSDFESAPSKYIFSCIKRASLGEKPKSEVSNV